MQMAGGYEEEIPMMSETKTAPPFLMEGRKYQGHIARKTIPQRWKAFMSSGKLMSDIALRDVACGEKLTFISAECDERDRC